MLVLYVKYTTWQETLMFIKHLALIFFMFHYPYLMLIYFMYSTHANGLTSTYTTAGSPLWSCIKNIPPSLPLILPHKILYEQLKF